MEITVLGSGTAIPDGERGSPGLAVSTPGSLLFLDLGSGSLGRAAAFGIDVGEVDAVLLTHLHPDHTGDLVPLLFAFRNPEWPRNKELDLVGPVGMEVFVQGLEAVYGEWIEARGYVRRVRELEAGTPFDVAGLRVRTGPVLHGPPAVAYEITDREGRRVVYSGDTAYCRDLAAFARGADLLILECSFPEGEGRPGHLTPSVAGQLAGEAACRRLLLTHFYPACKGRDLLEPCRRAFGGEITLARDGLRIEV